MNTERDNLVKEIFANALEKADATERAAYLTEACRDDAELRREVEKLLDAHAQAGNFLNQPTLVVSQEQLRDEGPGSIIDRYKLLQLIGEGGFGRVYMAEQREPVRRKVALKIIKLGMDTREVVARFEAERQALALMDHPNIAQVHDGGATSAGRPYFVMELVKGIPITDYCDRENLPTEARLHLFMKVCQAVQHAHQKGIIHRDLKPANVLVTVVDGAPVPKVIDFGIAKAIGQELTQKTLFTRFEQMIGTPAYLSPEQAALSGVDVDTRSDIYSLGVMLYELLTGTTPVQRETLHQAALDEIRRLIRETEPPKPSTRLQTLGPRLTEVAQHRHTEPSALAKLVRGDLDWIVMKCLEKDRTRRYETANALALDIHHHVHHEPVAASPPSTIYRMGKFVRRHRAGVGMGVALTAALVLGLVMSLWQAGVARQAQQWAEAARQKEAQSRQRAEREELSARRNLYAADMNLANQAVEAGNLGRARDLLSAHQPALGQPDLRGFEWRYLWAAARGDNSATWRGHSNVVTSVAVSPDGKTVLSGSQDTMVRMWDLASGRCIGILPQFPMHVYSVAFSPDGKLFAVGSEEGATLWSSATRERLSILGGRSARVAFSPVGSLLAFGTSIGWWQGDGQSVTLINYATGESVATFPEGGSHAAFSSDGKLLALAGRNNGVRVWDIGSRREVAVLRKAGTVMGLAFTPDARKVVASYWGGELLVWDVALQQVQTSLVGHRFIVWQVAFSPDGQTMATVGSDQTVRLWDVATWQTKAVLRGHGNEVWSVAFTPDGQALATGSKDETIMLYPVRPSRPVDVIAGVRSALRVSPDGATLPVDVAGVRSPPQVSPDGSTLAAANAEGKVCLWDLTTGLRTAELPGTNWPVGFLPEGHCLVTLGAPETLTFWDVASRSVQSQTTLRGAGEMLWAALSPDAQTVATGDAGQQVRFWNARTGEARGVLESRRSDGCMPVFSPDGRLLVTVGIFTASIWDVATLQLRSALRRKHKMFISTCAWSPDGKLLATGSADGNTILWDTSTGTDLVTLTGQQMEGIGRLTFSRDGRTLASSGSGVVKLWNLATHRDVATVARLNHPYELLFSPEDRVLCVGCSDGTLQLLRAPSFAEIAAEEKRLAVPR